VSNFAKLKNVREIAHCPRFYFRDERTSGNTASPLNNRTTLIGSGTL
jgi:hypothetical protein